MNRDLNNLKIQNFTLYGVTDVRRGDSAIEQKIEDACRGGVDIIQLRSKELSDGDLYRVGLKIKIICANYGVLFFINDRLDLALALDADGIHVGQDDLPVSEIRKVSRRAGTSLFVGKSTHSLEQAMVTSSEDVDYIGIGPVFGTPTKPDYVPVGPGLLTQVAEAVHKPFVAIGGVDLSNMDELMKHGARRFAVVRALFDKGDVYESARKLRAKIESGIGANCEK